jgi:hypothetical protein
MTVRELKEWLADKPDDWEVYYWDEYRYRDAEPKVYNDEVGEIFEPRTKPCVVFE